MSGYHKSKSNGSRISKPILDEEQCPQSLTFRQSNPRTVLAEDSKLAPKRSPGQVRWPPHRLKNPESSVRILRIHSRRLRTQERQGGSATYTHTHASGLIVHRNEAPQDVHHLCPHLHSNPFATVFPCAPALECSSDRCEEGRSGNTANEGGKLVILGEPAADTDGCWRGGSVWERV